MFQLRMSKSHHLSEHHDISIGKPLRPDNITASQRILSYARVLVNLDVSKPSPSSITVELEGDDAVVDVEVFLYVL